MNNPSPYKKLTDELVAEFEEKFAAWDYSNKRRTKNILSNLDDVSALLRSQYRTIAEATAQAGVVEEKEREMFAWKTDNPICLVCDHNVSWCGNAYACSMCALVFIPNTEPPSRQASIAKSNEWLGLSVTKEI